MFRAEFPDRMDHRLGVRACFRWWGLQHGDWNAVFRNGNPFTFGNAIQYFGQMGFGFIGAYCFYKKLLLD